MRVVSLLPAATEIVAALGLVDQLVGVSHECDHPAAVTTRPRVTRCTIHGNALPSDTINAWVTDTLGRTGTLYEMDEPLLRSLEPDVILTQRLCDVCAVGYGTVTAFAATLPHRHRGGVGGDLFVQGHADGVVGIVLAHLAGAEQQDGQD